MPLTLEAIEMEVLKLPASARSHLLDRLISSVDADPAVQQAWEVTAERRDQEIDQGFVQPVHGPDLINRLRSELQ